MDLQFLPTKKGAKKKSELKKFKFTLLLLEEFRLFSYNILHFKKAKCPKSVPFYNNLAENHYPFRGVDECLLPLKSSFEE